MACEVEVMNGTDLNEKKSLVDDSENEILVLKQSLKDKLHDAVNGTMNGNNEVISSSGSSSVVNNDRTAENGIEDGTKIVEGENLSDSRKKTQKKMAKGKLGKAKRESPSKSKNQPSIKKVDVSVEEESTQSEQSWNGTESVNKDTEDDTSTIDVVNDNDDQITVDDNEISIDVDVKEEINEKNEENAEYVKEESVFYRLCNSMRFSVSPRKKDIVSESSSNSSICSVGSSSMDNKSFNHSFRGISGRRALYSRSSRFESCEVEPSMSPNLKRKAESETCEAPERKHFITSFSERSPGWKFFSSPFTFFWTPKRKDAVVSNSTPLRQLHEDVDLEDSMAVNVDDSTDVSFHEDLDVEKEMPPNENYSKNKEAAIDEEKKCDDRRCIIM